MLASSEVKAKAMNFVKAYSSDLEVDFIDEFVLFLKYTIQIRDGYNISVYRGVEFEAPKSSRNEAPKTPRGGVWGRDVPSSVLPHPRKFWKNAS